MHFLRSPSLHRGPRAEAASITAGALALSLAVVAVAAGLGGDGQAAWLLVAAPWLEETVCRWGVQDGLEQAGLSPTAAAGASALGFAALHGLSRSWGLAVAVLVPALWLSLLYRHQRRLLPCVAWHAGFNAAWLLATALAPATVMSAMAALKR